MICLYALLYLHCLSALSTKPLICNERQCLLGNYRICSLVQIG